MPTVLLCVAVLIVFGPHAVKVGHFFDGVTYAGIARQMSLGIGTFWCPRYSPFLSPEFYGHLPLWLGWQAVFFVLLGDTWVVEGVFLLVNLALHGLAFRWVWNEFRRSAGDAELPSWHAAVALYLTAPIVTWAWSNNMLEIGVSFFSILAMGASLTSLRSTGKHWWLWSIAAAWLTILAAASKGVVGLFPLASGMAWWWWRPTERRRVVHSSTTMIAAFAGTVGMLALALPEAGHYVTKHLQIQLVPALKGELHVTTAWRANILWDALLDLLPMGILTGMWIRWGRVHWTETRHRAMWTWLLIALTATLPLCATLKQRTFYVVPAMPYYAMAAAVWWGTFDPWTKLGPKGWKRAVLGVALLGIVGCLRVFNSFGEVSRDHAKWDVARRASEQFPPGTVFEVNRELAHDYTMIAILVRTSSLYITDHPPDDVTHALVKQSTDEGDHYQIVPRSTVPTW